VLRVRWLVYETGTGGRPRLSAVVDPAGRKLTFHYAPGQFALLEGPDGSLTSYTYDGNGNRLTQTDALDQTRRYEYDALDRRRATEYADGARETYTYDENGNQTGQTDAKGQVTTWEYDALDRETLRTYSLPSDPAGPTGDDLASIATEYDANGNRTRATETYTGATGVRVTERTYDLFDRLETVTDPHGETLTYAYDANGNRTGLTDPDGQVTRYTFDALNRPTAVTNAAGVTEYAYLRDGRLSEVRYPNGTTTTQTYDAAGRTETIANRQGTLLVSSYLYEYDGNGNRSRQVEDNGAGPEETTYVYDRLDRLTESHYPEKTVTHTYDAAGNRLTEQALDAATGTLIIDKVYTYDERNRLLALTDRLAPDGPSSGSVDYTYDANGNQTSRAKAGVTTTFRYSVRNRLIEVREGGALTGSYLYDHQGLRVAKRAGTGETIRYLYDDQSVLLQTDLAGETIAKYDYGPDRLLSLEHTLDGRQYYLFDALGSVVNLTDGAGAIQARYLYDAWGNHRRTAGQSPNPFGFTGHERDDETGLYYAKARYYDPELGVFLTQDPFEGVLDTPPSLHRYLYAYQNPTVYLDPSGRVTEIKLAQTVIRLVRENILRSTGDNDESQGDQQDPGAGDDVNDNSLLAAGLGLVDSALELANLAANSLVLAIAPRDSRIRNDVEAEIDQAIDNVKAGARQALASTKKLIVEDPDGMVKLVQVPDQIILNGLRTGVMAVGAPDPEVRARNRAAVYEFAGETLLLAGAAEGAGQAVRVVRRGVRATEGISGLAEGAEIVEQTAVSGRRLGAVSEGVGPGGEVFETGVNVTPRSSAVKFRTIGRGSRTFVTEPDALESVIGPLEGNRISISAGQARQLESALGLRPNSLEARNIISIVENVSSRLPGSPITGNPLFKGGGAGLPGGGQELTIQGIPSAGGPGIRQVILEVR